MKTVIKTTGQAGPAIGDLPFEAVLDLLELPIDPADLFDQLGEWKPLETIDMPFLSLSEPAFLEAAVAILLELLKRKRGLDMTRLALMVRLVELAPTELYSSGAFGRTEAKA